MKTTRPPSLEQQISKPESTGTDPRNSLTVTTPADNHETPAVPLRGGRWWLIVGLLVLAYALNSYLTKTP